MAAKTEQYQLWMYVYTKFIVNNIWIAVVLKVFAPPQIRSLIDIAQTSPI